MKRKEKKKSSVASYMMMVMMDATAWREGALLLWHSRYIHVFHVFILVLSVKKSHALSRSLLHLLRLHSSIELSSIYYTDI